MGKKWLLLGILFLILVPIILFLLRKDNTISREECITLCQDPNSHFYDWKGLEIHYTEHGAGEETILMVHGFGGSHKNFESLAEILKTDYRVIAIDIPAFGLSEVPNLDLANNDLFPLYQSFVKDAFKSLNIEKYHLIGNSLGGWISWDLAAKQDTNLLSLTLLNSAGYGMDKVKEKVSGWMTGPASKFIFKNGVPYQFSQVNAERCLWDDTKLNEDKVRQNYYMLNKEGTFPWMMKMVMSTQLPDTNAIRNISCPTLIIWGDHDEVVSVDNAARFEEDIAGSVKIIYKNCGHIPQVEYPDRVAEDWLSFVMNLKNR
jgi:pimeloyl-ACP methyl ester carboxylesterase